ncbi:uracil-DNA glycosylase [Piscinibacter defluvii]|uniref:uracil-DNA glycosylase n=1 Tax=Piscinibacter defluvii TaxID=1796922 RepID=UPI000FDEC77E|nr:uracil-DNA glycosylase [Piscinibacter defluvii]
MRWTERQRALLEAMGLRLWLPAAAPQPEPVLESVHESVHESATAPDARAFNTPAFDAPPAAPVPIAPAPTAPAAARRPAGVATMDWAALREAVAGCTACKLCQGRRQTVFGVGNEQARWMIVGEAPGEQEDRQGEPFVGKSGQLLDNMLRAIGLTRSPDEPSRQVYIANTLKCRPPGNRNPEPEELAQCEPFLIRQIELIRPRIILAMGRFAVQSLLRSHEPIGRLRGRVHRYQGVPLIVTYHPAYLLRNLEDKARAWDDLCLARETFAALPAEGHA